MANGMDLYQKKYSILKRKCEELHQTNEKLVNRIQQVKRILKRYKLERRMLIEELDKHGDDFREAEVPPVYEVAGGCDEQELGDVSVIPSSSLMLSDEDKVVTATSSDVMALEDHTNPSLVSLNVSPRVAPLGR